LDFREIVVKKRGVDRLVKEQKREPNQRGRRAASVPLQRRTLFFHNVKKLTW